MKMAQQSKTNFESDHRIVLPDGSINTSITLATIPNESNVIVNLGRRWTLLNSVSRAPTWKRHSKKLSF